MLFGVYRKRRVRYAVNGPRDVYVCWHHGLLSVEWLYAGFGCGRRKQAGLALEQCSAFLSMVPGFVIEGFADSMHTF